MTRVKNIQEEIHYEGFASIREVTFDYQDTQGDWHHIKREVYDRGNGASALLYNRERNTVLLTEQFRMPSFLNGNPSGMLIEACAGKQDETDPKKTILREIEEELGYKLPAVEKVMEVYMTPGGSTEIIHLYLGEYSDECKVNDGGGLDCEQEDIRVVEYAFAKALSLIKTGEIKDAKTVILLQHLQLSGIMD
ncbi:NUDIX domain-containing protein [Dokdonia sinensis]|uniref:GDP-mannose pyrophosphatase n=1 Tax=Dokdonia sinensis TaxID=2479847 RepID=A0A3M0GFF5_9FLAO|nr:NUDIX domain-containing protein [Dokdonia sinensis]RMB63460.1 NUDIX domain-containing protein [Dokdonia sinensis]